MTIQPLSSKEANEITISTEPNIEKLRSLAFYWQEQAVAAHLKIKQLQSPITNDQAKQFAGK